MIDIFCPHCGFELTEAEVRRWTASLNGRRPKKREKMLAVTPNVEGEGFPPTLDTLPPERVDASIPEPAIRAQFIGWKPKKRAILSEATFEGDPIAPEYAAVVKTPPQEPIRDRAPIRHMAGMLCKHQRPKHLCLACERGRK